MLPNLVDIRERPPSINVSMSSEVFDADIAQGGNDAFQLETGVIDTAADNIDWDITLDSSQIDWDVGTVQETEENGNGLGPYEIVNASDIPSSPHKDGADTQHITEEAVVSDVSISEINWDISVDNPPEVEEAELVSNPSKSAAYQNAYIEATGDNNARSRLLETEYRNKILDDLFEVCIT